MYFEYISVLVVTLKLNKNTSKFVLIISLDVKKVWKYLQSTDVTDNPP